MKRLLLLLLFSTLGHTAELLPAEKAFAFKAQVNNNQVLLRWNIAPGYYLYKEKIKVSSNTSNQLGAPKLPAGKFKNDEFFGTVETYRNSIIAPMSILSDKQKTFVLNVSYQGCADIGVCYPPQQKTLDVVLTGDSVTNQNATVGLNEADKITALLQQDNILWVLASFFGFGLLLAFTPCVFPMIPILSGIIVGQKGEITTRKALVMSIVFVLAMSVTYSMAGALAGYFGENLQALFQTPWVLILFSAIFVALAFSMFGYYEIQLPSGLQNKITNISNKQEGGNLIGVAIMGFLSALIVGPCVAPPLAGALIYIGQTGDALLGGLSLFVMSLGMGAPLLLVGAGVSKLPKAGGWMDNIKYIFGILMLAVAIYLLDRITSPLTSIILWALLMTISPIAMGTLNTQTNTSNPWQRIFKALGLIILGYGILLWLLVARGGGDMLQPLSSWGASSLSTESAHVKFKHIKSTNELDQILAKAKNSNQVVMLDFYADWCISCKVLERSVFSNANVVKEMTNVIAIQADVTENNINDKALMKRFNIVGPPAILFFKNGIENRSQRIVGEVNAQNFLKALKVNLY